MRWIGSRRQRGHTVVIERADTHSRACRSSTCKDSGGTMSTHLQWQLHRDGSYDLLDGPVSPARLLSGVDGAAIRSVAVSAWFLRHGRNTPLRSCNHGELELVLDRDSTGLTLQATFSGTAHAPQLGSAAGPGLASKAPTVSSARVCAWAVRLSFLPCPERTH